MTIKTKLTLNVCIVILIVGGVALTSFLGMTFVRQKLSYLTERSTPYQMRTVEYQRVIQGATADLTKVAASDGRKQYEQLKAEAEKSLTEVKTSQEKLEALMGGQKLEASDELQKVAADLFRTTDARLRAEEQSGAASKAISEKLLQSTTQLKALDNRIKELQLNRSSVYQTSISDTQKISGKLRSVENLRTILKDLQISFVEVQAASTKKAIIISQAKYKAAIQKSLQNDFVKETKSMQSDLAALAEKTDEFLKAKFAYMAATSQTVQPGQSPPDLTALKTKLDAGAGETVDKLNAIMLAVEQEIVMANDRTGIENSRQGATFSETTTANKILAQNSELLAYGLTIEALATRLFTVNTDAEVNSIAGQITAVYQKITQSEKNLAASLTKIKATKEIGFLRGSVGSLAGARATLEGANGVIGTIKNRIAMEAQSAQAAEQLRQIVLKQAEKGKQTVTAAQGDQEKSIATVNKMVRFSLLLIMVIGAGAIVFGILFGGWIYRSIAKPLHHLITASDEVAHGNLQAHLASDSNDEVGQVQNSVGKMVEALRDVVDKIRTATDNLASNSEQLSSTATDLERGSQEQTSRIEQSATAMTEMNQTTIEVARNSSDTSEAAGKMKVIAEHGKTIMHQSVQELEAFAGTVREAAQKVESLGSQSEEINKVVILIKDIADQTNLLALNAAIEAARAGEQGRGFAVVADNVRQLAERTTQATDEIAHTVKSMQTSVSDSVKFMQSERDSVNRVMEGIRNTLDSIDQLVIGVEQVSDMVQRIAVAAEQQSSTSEEITQNMTSIAEITHELRKSFEQINNSSHGLSQLASDLTHTVSWFKVA